MEEGKEKCSPKSDKEDKSVTSQVLDYYKHYSQNHELPKYFCGTSDVQQNDWKRTPIVINPVIPIIAPTDKEIPKIHIENVCIPLPSSSVASNRKLEWDSKETPKIHIENVCIPSPSSSIASNRKLEWDSGADIGYSNTSLHKSVSLPVLTDAEYEKLRNNLLDNQQPVQSKCAEPKSDVNLKLSDLSSTSESLKLSCRDYISTTPSSSGLPDDFIISDYESSKAKRLKSLTKKVGLPIAQSTQLSDGMDCSTPNPGLTKIDLKVVDRISQYKNMKLLKLDVCKPVVVECSGLTQPSGRSKQVQTSLSVNAVSIGVQTDFDFNNCQVITPNGEMADRQKVFYVCHADSIQENDLTNSSTMHTQTPSDFSNCDSFQYFGKSTRQTKRSKSVKHPDSCYTSAESDKENLPKQLHGDSLTRALLKNKKENGNMKDLQRTIDLLQKLMHSTKYDSLTKKYYLKAIVKQFVDSKSDSSESILPKSELSENVSTLSEGGSINKEVRAERINKEVADSAKKKVLKKLRSETFTNEIPPIPLASNNGHRRLRRSHFTLTDSDLYDTVAVSTNASTKEKERQGTNAPILPLLEQVQPLQQETPPIYQGRALINGSLSSRSVTKNESEKSWREDMTRSEKLLAKGSGDVSSLGKSQLDDHIGWINEVGKLKEMLQTKTSVAKELCKPRIEELNGISKTTTVYVLSTEKEIVPPGSGVGQKQETNTRSTNCKCSDKSPTFHNGFIEVGGDKIHLQDAHLVSSEEFTSKADNAKCTTILRRYTFEIPLEELNSNNVDMIPVYEGRNSLKNRSGESSKKSKTSESSSSNDVSGAPHRDSLHQRRSSKDDKKANRSEEKDASLSNGTSGEGSKSGSATSHENDNLAELKSRPLGKKNGRSHKKKLKQQVLSIETVTHLDVPSIEKRKESEVGHLPNPTNELDDEVSQLKEVESTYSSQSETTSSASVPPKNYSTLIEELVYIDEITSSSQTTSSNSQESKATKNKTLSKEFVYSDSIPSAYIAEKPISSLCTCCKEREVQVKTKCCQCCDTQSVSSDNEKYILCYPCYNYHQQFAYAVKPYYQNGYDCTCYPKQCVARPGTVEEMKKAIRQLESLETETELCHCNETVSSTNFCEDCNCRLRSRYRRRKGGLAYALTLESDDCLYSSEQNFPMESLEEIKIRVPSPTAIAKNRGVRKNSNHKQYKTSRDKSEQIASKKCFCSCHSGEVVSDQTQTASVNQASKGTNAERTSQKPEEVLSTSRCKCKPEERSRGKSTCKSCKPIDPENDSQNFAPYDSHGSRSKTKKDKSCTLQEYLCKNRPTFIVMAEQRRQCLFDLATVREEHSKKYRQILACNKQIPSPNNSKPSQNLKVKRPFSSKEMKQITANNYKKCPEVKRKLEDVRERQIKKANKLIYDVFNQNLQHRVLKGKHSLPIEATVVNFY